MNPLPKSSQTSAGSRQLEEDPTLQDAAALAWLAVSELQPAPDSLWQDIQSRIHPDKPTQSRRPIVRLLLTSSGWAAAAGLAIAWWTQDAPSLTKPESPDITPLVQAPSTKATSLPPSLTKPEPTNPALLQELARLRQRIAETTQPQNAPGTLRPAIVELRAPGQTKGAASPTESAASLQQLLTKALQRDLLLRDGRDGADIVLERGWPRAEWLAADSGQTIRHLSFPANRWEELGLWKAPDLFYDPATSLTWSPAPDGLGYLGRVSPTPPDPSGFQIPSQGSTAPAPTLPETKASPAGYLVSEPGTQDSLLLLTDLPPAAPGTEQVVIASSSTGLTQQYLVGSTSLTNGEGITLSSLSLSNNFTNFSVIQRGTNGGPSTVILTNSPSPP